MTPFTAETPRYPQEIQELLVAIATAPSERVRIALQKEYYLWQREDSLAKQKEAERKARLLASGATPEEVAELIGKDPAGAAQKLATYLGGVAHSAQIRKDFPTYWMVTVAVGDKVTTLGASETIRAMSQTNKPTSDRWVGGIIGPEWNPPPYTFAEVFFGG